MEQDENGGGGGWNRRRIEQDEDGAGGGWSRKAPVLLKAGDGKCRE